MRMKVFKKYKKRVIVLIGIFPLKDAVILQAKLLYGLKNNGADCPVLRRRLKVYEKDRNWRK